MEQGATGRSPERRLARVFGVVAFVGLLVGLLGLFLFLRSGEIAILVIGAVLGVGLLGPLALVGWFGLRFGRPWGRSLALGLAVIMLFIVPIGTAVGVYALLLLLAPHRLDGTSGPTAG